MGPGVALEAQGPGPLPGEVLGDEQGELGQLQRLPGMVRRLADALGGDPLAERPGAIFPPPLDESPPLRRRVPLQTVPEEAGALAGTERLPLHRELPERRADEARHRGPDPDREILDPVGLLRGGVGGVPRRPGSGAVGGESGERGVDHLGRQAQIGDEVLQTLAGEPFPAPLVLVDQVRGDPGRLSQLGLAPALARAKER